MLIKMHFRKALSDWIKEEKGFETLIPNDTEIVLSTIVMIIGMTIIGMRFSNDCKGDG